MTSNIMNTHLSCREASAALAMVALRTEPVVCCFLFAMPPRGVGNCPGGIRRESRSYGIILQTECVAFCDTLTELPFTSTWTLNSIVEHVNGMSFGGTDCALPMLWAMEKKKLFDVFMVFTDNETWFGQVSVVQWRLR